MQKTFPDFFAAISWAKRYAKESTLEGCQYWRVIRTESGYAVGVFSKNTGTLHGYAY